jgi:hypothetical protein
LKDTKTIYCQNNHSKYKQKIQCTGIKSTAFWIRYNGTLENILQHIGSSERERERERLTGQSHGGSSTYIQLNCNIVSVYFIKTVTSAGYKLYTWTADPGSSVASVFWGFYGQNVWPEKYNKLSKVLNWI